MRSKTIALVAGLLSLGSAAALAASGPLEVSAGTQLPARWTPDQHLYTKGNIKLPAQKLIELETWLTSNAPNWTVLLAEDSKGESFEKYRGMDAVEHAMGKGLANNTPFGDLTHPKTGQRNGAFFIMFVNERKLSYYASDAYDKRRLGDNNWIGNLDKPAIRAMRGGGRIIDAVKDTITNVDGLLERRIISEENARKRLQEEARTAVESAEEVLTYAEEDVRQFKETTGHPDGDIATPDLAAWKGQLTSARNKYDTGDHSAAVKEAKSLESNLRAHLRRIEDHQKDAARITALQNALTQTQPHPQSPRAARSLQDAEAALAKARAAHQKADSAYLKELNNANLFKSRVLQENTQTLQQIAFEEHQRQREKQIRRFAAGAAATLFLAFLVFLNRNRLSDKKRAQALLAQWQSSFKTKRDTLFKLLDDSHAIVGTQHELEESGTTGETLRLSKTTIHNVDDLFIMSASVDRVIDDAETLIHPPGLLGKFRNLFSKKAFRNACRLLEEDPVSFSPEEGLAAILTPRNPETEAQPLRAENADRKPFALTFEKLVSEFDDKASHAGATLDLLKNAWESVGGDIEKLGTQLDQLETNHSKLVELGAEDAFFLLPALPEEAVPHLGTQLDAATATAGNDPVHTLNGVVADSDRQLSELTSLVDGLLTRRARDFPAMKATTARLRQDHRDTTWVPQCLEERSLEANALVAESSSRSVQEPASDILAAVDTLRDHVQQAKKLNDRVLGPSREDLAVTRQNIDDTRREIAASLQLPESDILSEQPVLDPDTHLASAESLVEPIELAIDRGGVAAAQAALDELAQLTGEANALIKETRDAWKHNAPRREALETRCSELQAQLTRHTNILDELTKAYAPSALKISHVSPDHYDRAEDILKHREHCETAFEEIAQNLEDARTAHARGKIFTAAASLERGNNLGDEIHTWFAEIQAQSDAIRQTEKENGASLTRLEQRLDTTRQVTNDPKVMRPTRDAFQDILVRFTPAAEACAAPFGQADPFQARHLLSSIKSSLDDLDQMVANDRESHASAARVLAHVAGQMDDAKRKVYQARHDQIPDSAATTRHINTIESSEPEYQRLQQALDQPHGDWPALEADADLFLNSLAEATAALRGELQRAQACLKELERATKEARRAKSQAGLFAGMLGTLPYQKDLDFARGYLRGGDYNSTLRYARRSRSHAATAIAQAQRAAARRRRSSSFSSSGSSFGRSSGSSFSSGSSRSSFSSGSGVSRSGW